MVSSLNSFPHPLASILFLLRVTVRSFQVFSVRTAWTPSGLRKKRRRSLVLWLREWYFYFYLKYKLGYDFKNSNTCLITYFSLCLCLCLCLHFRIKLAAILITFSFIFKKWNLVSLPLPSTVKNMLVWTWSLTLNISW